MDSTISSVKENVKITKISSHVKQKITYMNYLNFHDLKVDIFGLHRHKYKLTMFLLMRE